MRVWFKFRRLQARDRPPVDTAADVEGAPRARGGWAHRDERDEPVTKRDFIALADELRGLDISADVLGAIVRFCKGRNSRFLEALWLGYLAGECGPNGGPIKRRATALQKAGVVR